MIEDILWGLWNGLKAWPLLLFHVFGVWERYPSTTWAGRWVVSVGFLMGAGSPFLRMLGPGKRYGWKRGRSLPLRPRRFVVLQFVDGELERQPCHEEHAEAAVVDEGDGHEPERPAAVALGGFFRLGDAVELVRLPQQR